MTSIHQPVNYDDLAETEESVRAFREAGLDLMLFYLPPPHSPQQLTALAEMAERVG